MWFFPLRNTKISTYSTKIWVGNIVIERILVDTLSLAPEGKHIDLITPLLKEEKKNYTMQWRHLNKIKRFEVKI